MKKMTYESPLGSITVLGTDKAVAGLWFEGQQHYGAQYDLGQVDIGVTKPIALALRWLDAYFAGANPDPATVPLAPETTPFREKVFQALQKVPFGRTTTYKQLAEAVQAHEAVKRNLARAVGNAVAHNPILLLIPCHRVLGSGGALTGYAGGVERKQALLELEQGHKLAGGRHNEAD